MKVSVIIATYNRFELLLRALQSVLVQTYPIFEIIVVNDNSSDSRYQGLKMPKTKIIHLDNSSRSLFGFPSAGYTRDIAIKSSSGDLIAILDDDDFFLPNKLEVQISIMKSRSYPICASEAYMILGKYSEKKKYPIYHQQFYKEFCESFFGASYKGKLPNEFSHDLIQSHNFIIHSSVVFTRELYDKVGGYENVINGEEDWNLFKKMLKIHPCFHLNDPLLCYSYSV